MSQTEFHNPVAEFEDKFEVDHHSTTGGPESLVNINNTVALYTEGDDDFDFIDDPATPEDVHFHSILNVEICTDDCTDDNCENGAECGGKEKHTWGASVDVSDDEYYIYQKELLEKVESIAGVDLVDSDNQNLLTTEAGHGKSGFVLVVDIPDEEYKVIITPMELEQGDTRTRSN